MLFLVFITSGLFLGWSLGANDAANIFGSAVGSKMLSFKKAAIIASIFVLLGAVFQGQGGSETLNKLGSVDALGGAFTVSLCAAFIVFSMNRRGIPVSTSQAIVGAIIGWSYFTGNRTDYSVLGKIVGTWISGPILGMLIAAGLFILMRRILRKAVIHLFILDYVIRIGLIVVGAFGAYSLGANNIANVMGVFVSSAPDITLDFGLFVLRGEQILFLMGGLAIAVGIFTYSERMMNKIGNGILSLTPEAAIVVVLAQAIVLYIFSSQSLANLLISIGLPPFPLVPVSSTQIVIGSLTGIGLVKGAQELKIKALGGVFIGWITTPVAAGILTYFALFVVKNVFNLQVSAVKNITAEGFDPLPAIAISPVQINMILPAVLVITLALFVTFVMLYIRQQKLRMKAENEILVQQNQSFASQKSLNEMEMNAIQKENETLSSKLEARRREVTNLALNIAEQRAFFSDLAEKIDSAINEDNPDLHKGRLNELALMVRQRMTFSKETEELFGQIELLQRDFQMKLESEFPGLTLQDKRLATFLRLNLSSKEIASLMNITPKSVEIARYRFRKKLNLSPGINLNQYLSNI
jgi:inorganic phosphate transporter, PiT family